MSSDDKSTPRLEHTAEPMEPDWNLLMSANRTGADGTTGLAHGEQIKAMMRTRASMVTVTLSRKHTRGQNMESVICTKRGCKKCN